MMTPMAVAAFVKTPGRSPLKTRLAAGIGQERAEAFYRLAVAAVEAVMKTAVRRGLICAHWAIAELDTADAWPSLPTVLQGEGGLGDRLDRVYSELWRLDRPVALIGADAPALTVDHFVKAQAALASGSDFVMGPAADGGFYLFVGTKPIPRALWNAIPYSQDDTAHFLAEALLPLGKLTQLATLGDVDTADDLPHLAAALRGLAHPLPEQSALLEWVTRGE